MCSIDEDNLSIHYVYLLKEREFIKTKENIYKIGKTTQLNLSRFSQYPIGSCLLLQLICDNCHKVERLVIEKFKIKYNHRKDIGAEYFEHNNYNDLINDIYQIVNCKDNNCKDNVNSCDRVGNNVGFFTKFEYEMSEALKKRIRYSDYEKEMIKQLYETIYLSPPQLKKEVSLQLPSPTNNLYDCDNCNKKNETEMEKGDEPEKKVGRLDLSRFRCKI
jgi:hypothetical protein